MRLPAFLAAIAGLAVAGMGQAAAAQSNVYAPTPRDRAFDLASVKKLPKVVRGVDRLPNPQLPHGCDLRLIAYEAPELDLPLGAGGAVMTMGALGSRYKNMPSLVHVGVAWDF